MFATKFPGPGESSRPSDRNDTRWVKLSIGDLGASRRIARVPLNMTAIGVDEKVIKIHYP